MFAIVQMRKAKKEHECIECGETIKKGDRYEYLRGKWKVELSKESMWATYRTCVGCCNVRNSYLCKGENYTIGEMWKQLRVFFIYKGISDDDLRSMLPAKAWS